MGGNLFCLSAWRTLIVDPFPSSSGQILLLSVKRRSLFFVLLLQLFQPFGFSYFFSRLGVPVLHVMLDPDGLSDWDCPVSWTLFLCQSDSRPKCGSLIWWDHLLLRMVGLGIRPWEEAGSDQPAGWPGLTMETP